MTFSQWDKFEQSDAGTIATTLDVGSPLIGVGSINFEASSAVTIGAALAQLNNTFTRGLTKGRIRTILEIHGATWSNSGLGHAGPGIFWGASSLDITSTLSNWYWFGIGKDGGALNMFPLVCRAGGGNPQREMRDLLWRVTSNNVIASGASSIAMVLGDTLPIQAEWDMDNANYGGTRITCSVGNVGDTDFTNLTVIYDFVDPASEGILTATVEGVGLIFDDNSPTLAVGHGSRQDETTVFQLT